MLKVMDFNHLEKHMKPFDLDETKYEWPDCVVWNRTQRSGYKFKVESPTVLSFGLIFLFIFLMKYMPVSSSEETSFAIFTLFLVSVVAIPIVADSLQKLVITQLISGLRVVRIQIRHIDANRTFVVEDVVRNWNKSPYHPIKRGIKSKPARNRGSIELELKNAWCIGKVENPHIFNKITIWGNSTYLQSLDSLAHYHVQETDIFGVPVKTGVYEFSLKVEEKSWDPAINQYVAISWATRETAGEYKRMESFLVVTKEEKISSCPHCGLSLSDDELEATDRLEAQGWKEQAFHSTVKAKHEEELKDQTVRSDFKKKAVQDWLDKHYTRKLTDLLNLKKLKWWQWCLIGLGVFVFCYLAFPGFRLFIQSIPDRLSGVPPESPPTTTPVETTTAGGNWI